MICVEFLAQPDGRVMGFRVEPFRLCRGRADIVCAAVSSAAYLIVNSVTEVRGVSPLCLPGRGRRHAFPDRAEGLNRSAVIFCGATASSDGT